MKKILLIIFVSADIILLLFLGWCVKELRFGSVETAQWKNRERDIVKYERIINAFDEKKIIAEHSFYIKRIPADMTIPLSAMKILKQWAADLNLDHIHFIYDPKDVLAVQGVERLRVVPFRVILSGTYESILAFLEHIPSSDVLIMPVSLEMKRGGSAPSVSATILINTFTSLSR